MKSNDGQSIAIEKNVTYQVVVARQMPPMWACLKIKKNAASPLLLPT